MVPPAVCYQFKCSCHVSLCFQPIVPSSCLVHVAKRCAKLCVEGLMVFQSTPHVIALFTSHALSRLASTAQLSSYVRSGFKECEILFLSSSCTNGAQTDTVE